MREWARRETASLLKTLADHVNRTAEAGGVDQIHDLRVAIRRLESGLRLFQKFYPKGAAKAVRSELRHVLHAAGAVRDRDIALEKLAQAGVGVRAPIAAQLRRERTAANGELLAAVREWQAAGVSRVWRERLDLRRAAGDRASVRDHARRMLPRLTAEYFARVRVLMSESEGPEDLHAIRLATKRFRYTLELFRGCYGTGFGERLEALRRVQQLLGELNDSVASWRLLSEKMPKSPSRRKVREFLKHEARRRAEAFQKEWAGHFDAPGRSVWWIEYLRGAVRCVKAPR